MSKINVASFSVWVHVFFGPKMKHEKKIFFKKSLKMDPALFCSFFLRVWIEKSSWIPVRCYFKSCKLCSQIMFPFLETHFFVIFKDHCSLTYIMVIIVDDLGRHLLLTEKKEPAYSQTITCILGLRINHFIFSARIRFGKIM